MKLRIIQNTKTRKASGPAKIRLNAKGAITINKAGVEKTGLKANDRIMILQDEDKPNDWYVVKTDNESFSPFRQNSTGKSIIANYAQAYTELSEFYKIPKGEAFDINIGGSIKTEFGTAHVLITAPLIEIKRKAEKGGVQQ